MERGEATHNSHVGHERNLDPRDLGEEVRPLGLVTHSRAHIVSGVDEGPDCVPGVSSSAAGRTYTPRKPEAPVTRTRPEVRAGILEWLRWYRWLKNDGRLNASEQSG